MISLQPQVHTEKSRARRPTFLARGVAVLSAALLVWTVGCSGAGSSISTTTPTANVTTEMFTGTVTVGGSDAHPFSVALSNGQVNAILTAAGPPPTIYMGLGIGTPSGTTCTLLSAAYVVAQAGTIAQLTGTINAGSYCVAVSDAGNQTADVSYALTVTHY